MPKVVVQRPWWTLREAAEKVWVESKRRSPTGCHEDVDAACSRIFGTAATEKLSAFGVKGSRYELRAGGVVVVTSKPGATEIWKLWPRLYQAVTREIESSKLETRLDAAREELRELRASPPKKDAE